MEVWELIRRLLASANGGRQAFEPDWIGGLYHRHLLAERRQVYRAHREFLELAQEISVDMQQVGLIRPVFGAAMARTYLGEELLLALNRHNMVGAFESMQVELNAGEIRRVLRQLQL
jgi:hypothetical protein